MTRSLLHVLAIQSVFFCCSLAKIQGIYIGSVPSNILPPISLNVPRNRDHFVETSAEFAVNALNQELTLQRANSSQNITSLPLVLREVHSAASQIGEGIIVGALMEFDYGVRYEVKLALPHHVQHGALSLPSGEETQSPINYENPRFEEWKFSGPLEISFSKPRDDIKMRMPRDIDTGAIRKVQVDKDVDVKVNGLTSVKLLKPIEVELTSKQDRDGEALEVSWKQVPELEFDGNIVFQTENRVKVKRVNSLEVKFVNGTENAMKFGYIKKPSVSLAKENPLVQYLEKLILQTKAISGSPNVRLRRIISASADAVTLVLMPVELLSPDGVITNWNLIVTRDPKGNNKLFNYEQLQPTNAVSVEPSLAINPNGTLFETIDRFAPFLKTGTQLALE